MALITLAWAQLLTGTQQPVLSNVMPPLPHLAPMTWIPSIRNFLRTVRGRIDIEKLPIISLQRGHNQFIMDIALDLYSKPSNLQHLNACRLDLQVTLLSDITTVDGKFIRPEVPRLHRPLSNSAKTLCPYQPLPDSTGMTLWRAFLLRFTRVIKYSLAQPLGRWLHSSHTKPRKWKAYINLPTHTVYLRKQDILKCTKPSHPLSITNTLTPQYPPPPPPPHFCTCRPKLLRTPDSPI